MMKRHEHAFAACAVHGTYAGTFLASSEARLVRLRELANAVDAELVAKAAVHCHERGTPGVPVHLVAHLANVDVTLMARVFAHVVDDGHALCEFVRIVRSGVTGRKSFGSAPKRMLRAWFGERSPDLVFRQSIGTNPSMSDVIKMVRPSPKNDEGAPDAVREALYGYLIGKSVDFAALPRLAKAFHAFSSRTGPLPDAPFDMLTALPLEAEHWTALAKTMTCSQVRTHLSSLVRHGVLADPGAEIVDAIGKRLLDADCLRRARVLPLTTLLAQERAAREKVPEPIVNAIGEGLDHVTLPALRGRVVICPDVSGSMQSGFGSTGLRCLDVAALVAASVLKRHPGTTVLPFSGDVVPLELSAHDSVLATMARITSLPAAGTSSSSPLRWLARQGAEAPDVVVIVSDKQSHADFRGDPSVKAAWDDVRARNANAKLVLVDLRATGLFEEREDVLGVSGFSDDSWEVIASFTRGDLADDAALRDIQRVVL